MKTGLVVEGGGMKCAYSAGILDRFLDDGITFDECIGVSAGAGNTASFISRQRGRNLRFFVEHPKDPRYMGMLKETMHVPVISYIWDYMLEGQIGRAHV